MPLKTQYNFKLDDLPSTTKAAFEGIRGNNSNSEDYIIGKYEPTKENGQVYYKLFQVVKNKNIELLSTSQIKDIHETHKGFLMALFRYFDNLDLEKE